MHRSIYGVDRVQQLNMDQWLLNVRDLKSKRDSFRFDTDEKGEGT